MPLGYEQLGEDFAKAAAEKAAAEKAAAEAVKPEPTKDDDEDAAA